MCTTVRYQGTLFCKALMFTRIWFMWLVRFHWKTFLTMFTLIWFLICMNTNVFCQGNLFSKPFLTMFTLVWLILCNVWIRLCLVRLLFTEKYFWQCSHRCVFSFVWIRMCSSKSGYFFCKAFLTMFALMSTNVFCQGTSLQKAFLTILTLVSGWFFWSTSFWSHVFW